jgi:metal-responsive CopG/Arc/MetJ family transcriptional regulator
MNAPRTRASHVFTISFPEELAKQVVAVANVESRTISELFREAFRTYQVERAQRKLLTTQRIAAERTSLLQPEDVVETTLEVTGNKQLSRTNL